MYLEIRSAEDFLYLSQNCKQITIVYDILFSSRPYIKFEHEKIAGRARDKVHFAFTDGHPRDVPTNAIYYACLHGDQLKKGEQYKKKSL